MPNQRAHDAVDRAKTNTESGPSVRLFGALLIVPPGENPRSLRGRAARRVLCSLALRQPHPVGSERLIDEAWADEALQTPQPALRMTITRLRRALGGGVVDVIEHANGGYRLLPTVGSDVAEFDRAIAAASELPHPTPEVVDRLSAALRLWSGTPYIDGDDIVFRPEQQRLSDLRTTGFEQLVLTALSSGDLSSAWEHLPSLLVDNPHHDGLIGLHMRLLYGSGDQRGALQVYEDYRRRLLDETGLRPTPELQLLEGQVLRHEISPLRPAPRSTAPGLGWIVDTIKTAARRLEGSAEAGQHLVGRPDEAPPGLGTIRRAEVCAALGHWDDAAPWFLRSIEAALDSGDDDAAVDYCLRMAHVVWDPDLGATTAGQLHRLLQRGVSAEAAARLRLCLAGGLFRTGYEASVVVRRELDPSVATLERSEDAPSLAWGLTHYRDALVGELREPEALAVTERVAALDVDDPLLRGQTARARFVGLLRIARPAQALHALHAVRRERASNAANRFGAHAADNCWNLALGRWGPLQDGLDQLLDFKGRLGAATVDDVVLAQSVWLCRELGDPVAVAAHREGAQALAAVEPEVPHWPVVAAVMAADAGRWDVATAEMTEAVGVFGLTRPQQGAHRIGLLALVAEVLGTGKANGTEVERAIADDVLSALLEEDCEGVVFGWPAVYAGSKARFVGFAAVAAGRRRLAEEACDSAVMGDRWLPPLRRRSLLARSLVDGRTRSEDRHRADRIHETLITRHRDVTARAATNA